MVYLAHATAGVKTRSQTRLSSSLEKNLLAYAAAATAAGMGTLTGTPAADAKIIYTPANQQISGKVPLTFNKGGTPDFYLDTHHSGSCKSGHNYASGWSRRCWYKDAFSVQPGSGSAASNVVESTATWKGWGAALKAGAKIGRSDRFTGKGNVPLGQHTRYWHESKNSEAPDNPDNLNSMWLGPWVNGLKGKGVKNRYLGVKFKIKGKYHYGWARMSVTCRGKPAIAPTLTGYAYETIANKAIIAGKTKGPDVVTMPPDTLGSLAWGRR